MKQGELVERLRGWQGDMPDALKDDLQKAAKRLAEIEEANRDALKVIEALRTDLQRARDGLALIADENSWRGFSPAPQLQRMREHARSTLNTISSGPDQ